MRPCPQEGAGSMTTDVILFLYTVHPHCLRDDSVTNSVSQIKFRR